MTRSVAECESMTQPREEHRVKLMIAYRLHPEPGNLKAIESSTAARLETRAFSAQSSSNKCRRETCASTKSLGGPLMDV